eukprot:gene11546-11689_t
MMRMVLLPNQLPTGALLLGHLDLVKDMYQSRQSPVVSKPFKETFLPFWVGSGSVRVEVRGAEIGHNHLVTRYDRRTGRSEPHWETVWSRVSLNLAWERQLQPEEESMQLYASWKYNRRDVEVLRPGPLLQMARAITPDMLQATPGSGTDTRRVGPFTLDPQQARRLLMSSVEAQERRRAESEIAKLTGSQQVRSFVSGVDASKVSGVQVLDDTKLATVAAATTAGVGMLLGLSLPLLFWGGFVIPFVAAGVISRFWPLLRSTAFTCTQEVQAAFRGLALQHHPDRYSTAEDKARATKRFQGITEAYQVLRDPKKRQQYDSGQDRRKPRNATTPTTLLQSAKAATAGNLPEVLAATFPDTFPTLSAARRVIRKDLILIDGQIGSCKSTVTPGQELQQLEPLQKHKPPRTVSLEVAYEDDHLALVHKPWGVKMYGGDARRTITGALRAGALQPSSLADALQECKPVHRLDAAVLGHSRAGRFGGWLTSVALSPMTGRKHQLRQHMAALGHPIVGDGLYNHDKAEHISNQGIYLESLEVSFSHPASGQPLHISIPEPARFTALRQQQDRRWSKLQRQQEMQQPDHQAEQLHILQAAYQNHDDEEELEDM